tara:strand:- start:2331 stop:4559 length:2229 start_codon:yes stop_codon:yes gene_type:complete
MHNNSNSKDPEVQFTHDLLSEYSSARENWAKQAVEDNEFRNGKQWTKEQSDALRNKAQEPIVVNVIFSAVEQAKALLTANKPRFQSTARETSDTEVGRLFSDLMSYVWDNSNGNVELKQAIDDYYVKGMGVIMAYTDPDKDFGRGEVCLKSLDPLEVYFDPSSKDPFCRDSGHVLVAKLMSQNQLIQYYPEYEEEIKKVQETSHINITSESRHALKSEDVTLKSRIAGEELSGDRELEMFTRYSKVRMPYFKIYDPYANEEKVLNTEEYKDYQNEEIVILTNSNGEQQIFTDEKEVRGYIQLHESVGDTFHLMQDPMSGQPVPMAGEEHEGSIPNSTSHIDIASKMHLIEEEKILVNEIEITNIKQCVSIGDMMLYQSILPIEEYPIVPIMNGFNRNPYPMSDVRLVKGLQEYINKIRSLIIAHASSSTNVKLLIPRGAVNKQQVEQDWGRAGTAVIEFDPELGSPIVASPIPLPNELYKNEADAKADIERILGIYALMQGDMGAAPQTFKGTVALDEYGQRRIKSKRDDIEEGLNQLGKVVLGLMQYVYTDQKVLRLMQPNNKPKEVVVNSPLYDDIGNVVGKLNDITVGKYDIIVASGSTLPSNRWARFEYYMQLYQAGLIDQIELLKQTDVADMEGVLQRNGQMQQMQQQVQAQSEEIKKLKGDLQTAQRESLHDRKRVEVKEFEKKLAKAEAKVEMAQQLYKARLGDELKMARNDLSEASENNPQRQMNERILSLDEA